MNEREFIDRALAFGGPRVLKRSILSFPDGADTLTRVLGSGRYPAVLEIGTYRGVFAAFMAPMCKSVTTIDLWHGQLQQDGEAFDRRAFWDHMGARNIRFCAVHDDDDKARLVADLQFDLAFIDGGAVNVARDFELVRRCGAVLFHDYDQLKTRKVVFDFVNSLPAAEVTIIGMFALWRAQ